MTSSPVRAWPLWIGFSGGQSAQTSSAGDGYGVRVEVSRAVQESAVGWQDLARSYVVRIAGLTSEAMEALRRLPYVRAALALEQRRDLDHSSRGARVSRQGTLETLASKT